MVVEIDAELESLIPRFLENRHKDVQALSAALGSGDFPLIITVGHNMKGAGGGFGFHEISQIGARIETAGRAASVTAVKDCLATYQSYLAGLEVVFIR